MTYDVYGWVEVTPHPQDTGSWQGVLNLAEFVWHPNEVSLRLFGLAKWRHMQGISAAFADRGLPADLSSEAHAALQDIQDLDDQEREHLGFHGFSHATLAEIRQISISRGTSWDLLFERIAEIQRERKCSDSQVRIVAWALW